MRIDRSNLLIATLLFLVPCVRADTILVGTPEDPNLTYGVSFLHYNPQLAQAQAFIFDTPVIIDAINIGVFSDVSGGIHTFQLTDAIGPGASSSDVLFSVTGPPIPIAPCFTPPCLPPYLTITTPTIRLNPGEYFLTGAETAVLPSDLPGAGWRTISQSLGGVGIIANRFSSQSFNYSNPAQGDWIPNIDSTQPKYLDFQLLGTPLPEPASILLFGCGLLGLAGCKRREGHAD